MTTEDSGGPQRNRGPDDPAPGRSVEDELLDVVEQLKLWRREHAKQTEEWCAQMNDWSDQMHEWCQRQHVDNERLRTLIRMIGVGMADMVDTDRLGPPPLPPRLRPPGGPVHGE